MRSEIFFAGSGWILAGVISLIGWSIEVTDSAANPSNLLYTGIFVLVVGLSLFALNKKIEAIMEKMQKAAKRRNR